KHIKNAPTLVRTMMAGSAYCVSPPIALLSPAVNGEGYTSPHGIANFRQNRPEGAGHRDGDVAELRCARSGRGPAGDRRDSRARRHLRRHLDRKSTRLNSSHGSISYAVFCLKKKIP